MRKLNLISLAVAAALVAPMAHADNGDTTLGGLIYADLTHQSTTNGSNDVDPSGNGLDVKRAYIIVTHTFTDVWSANITTDFNFPSYTATSTTTVTPPPAGTTVSTTTTVKSPETQLFIKNAYVQGKFDDLAVLRVGAEGTPWIPYAESIYGYRFVENTLIDRTEIGGIGSFGNSADWGVNVNGANSLWNYSASLLNGNGYKNPSRSKVMDFEGRVGATPIAGLIIGVGYYDGSLGQDTNANQLAAESAPKGGVAQNDATRENALVAWKADGLTVGVEYFTAKNFSTKLIFTNTTDSEDGYTVYGSYDFTDVYSVFGRYDDVKPKKDTDSSLEDKYYNAGVSLKTDKNVTWALAYKNETLKDSGTINVKFNELGIWAQIKF